MDPLGRYPKNQKIENRASTWLKLGLRGPTCQMAWSCDFIPVRYREIGDFWKIQDGRQKKSKIKIPLGRCTSTSFREPTCQISCSCDFKLRRLSLDRHTYIRTDNVIYLYRLAGCAGVDGRSWPSATRSQRPSAANFRSPLRGVASGGGWSQPSVVRF